MTETGSLRCCRNPKNTPARHALALLATGIALLTAHVLPSFPRDLAPYIITAFPAIGFTAWCCGLGPSLLAVALLSAMYWSVGSVHSFSMSGIEQALDFVPLLLACGVIIAVGERSRRENEGLHKTQGELEDRVKERTAELSVANQRLSELTARLLQLQDDERRRIARDLHDSVGQTLAVLGMNLSAVETEMERVVEVINVVKDSRELLRETSTDIRTISYLLHPPLLDENGLSSALPWYVEGFAERSKIKVDLVLPENLGRLSRDSEVAIFRVVQECLTNIHRHSGSPSAKIRVTRSERDICIEVEDRGRGIALEKLHELTSGGQPGVGIRGMRERVRQLGGSLRVDSYGVGKGTAVRAQLPFLHSGTAMGQ
jgi:signal transduction histidine kinase